MTPVGVSIGSAVGADQLLEAGAAVVLPTLAALAEVLAEACSARRPRHVT
jgi:hypothetical protein